MTRNGLRSWQPRWHPDRAELGPPHARMAVGFHCEFPTVFWRRIRLWL